MELTHSKVLLLLEKCKHIFFRMQYIKDTHCNLEIHTKRITQKYVMNEEKIK